MHIGLAYAINDEVYIHSKWNSDKYGSVLKPKTTILLDENGEKVQFGLDAKYVLSIITRYNLLSKLANQ